MVKDEEPRNSLETKSRRSCFSGKFVVAVVERIRGGSHKHGSIKSPHSIYVRHLDPSLESQLKMRSFEGVQRSFCLELLSPVFLGRF